MVCAFQASRSVLSPACGLSVLLVWSAVVRNVGVFVTVPLTAPDFWYLGMSKQQQQQQQHSSNAHPAAMPTPLGLTSPQYWNLDTQMFLKVYTPHSDGTTIRSPSYTFCMTKEGRNAMTASKWFSSHHFQQGWQILLCTLSSVDNLFDISASSWMPAISSLRVAKMSGLGCAEQGFTWRYGLIEGGIFGFTQQLGPLISISRICQRTTGSSAAA